MLYSYHRQIQRQTTHLRNYKLCELVKVSHSSGNNFVRCCYFKLDESLAHSSLNFLLELAMQLRKYI